MTQLFLTSCADRVLDNIVTKLPKKPSEYQAVFISTAAEVEEGDLWWLRADRDKLLKLGFPLNEFSLTGLSESQVEEKLKNVDLIFVAGGNTFYLLDQAIKSGFDEILERKIKEGIIYIGSSAGSALVGVGNNLTKNLDDPAKAPDLKSNGLGIVDFVISPHWGSIDFRPGYQKSFADLYTENHKFIFLTNTQYLWVQNDQMKIIDVK